MRNYLKILLFFLFGLVILISYKLIKAQKIQDRALGKNLSSAIIENAEKMIGEGQQIFRFDTFGDEEFWGNTLGLHQAIEKVSPATALALGLKVDVKALPEEIIELLEKGEVDLNDPAITLTLLKLNAVVGVTGFFDAEENLQSFGIQCALCHSIVDDTLMPGIGHRLDGWANRDLNIGTIIALAPNLQPIADLLGIDVEMVRMVLNSWGPGKFDAALLLDGKAFTPDGGSAATLIPPAFGLAGVNLHTWGGWGSVTHWNAFVANIEMQGKGTFFDPRLNDLRQFPIAADAGFGNIRNTIDLITPKLAALHFYQLAIPSPEPPEDSFNQRAAVSGKVLFEGKAKCAMCHVPPLFTEPGWNMHTPEEIGIEDFQANRAPDRRYRTTPLKGLWTHMKGGFYHDGRFSSLQEVIEHYDFFLGLNLTEQEKSDLIHYLKSL
ncbi:MAG: hypothetical protein JSV09_15165 [Thermoplasmata archaeon]|nr:MAG: hypothetical protein JSV09_15165 [Thermoplasmata archaeon]